MTTEEQIERAIIKSFGIDAPNAEECRDCELWHLPWRECPPILPLGTATWEGLC